MHVCIHDKLIVLEISVPRRMQPCLGWSSMRASSLNTVADIHFVYQMDVIKSHGICMAQDARL